MLDALVDGLDVLLEIARRRRLVVTVRTWVAETQMYGPSTNGKYDICCINCIQKRLLKKKLFFLFGIWINYTGLRSGNLENEDIKKIRSS